MNTTKINNLIILDHPIISHNLAVIRDKNTNCESFNLALNKITYALIMEASKSLPTIEVEIETPLTKTKVKKIDENLNIIAAPILRAGLSFTNALQNILPMAKIYHLGMYRDENTLNAIWYYNKFEGKIKDPKNTIVFITDPMLATGNSAYDAVMNFKKQGVEEENIIFVCLVSAPDGVKKLTDNFPCVKIITASYDICLNAKGYIVPGLGDAGDRIFNTVL